jgi:hypothetical protein
VVVGTADGAADGNDGITLPKSHRVEQFDWAIDSKRSWSVAIKALRAEYLAHRKEGESAAEYMDRGRNLNV